MELARRKNWSVSDFMSKIENEVKFANINIIEGTGASQHGIGIVTARIVEAIFRDEGLVEPIGTLHLDFSVTLSLPTIIRYGDVLEVLKPSLSSEESEALTASAAAISSALAPYKK